jgi:hypothetical protein
MWGVACCRAVTEQVSPAMLDQNLSGVASSVGVDGLGHLVV